MSGFDSHLEEFPGFPVVLAAEVYDTQIVQSLGVPGLQGQSPLVDGLGLCLLAKFEKGQAQIGQYIGILAAKCQGFGKRMAGIPGPAVPQAGQAQVEGQIGRAWVKVEGCRKGRSCFLVPTSLQKFHATEGGFFGFSHVSLIM
jgi:hypothetical protein